MVNYPDQTLTGKGVCFATRKQLVRACRDRTMWNIARFPHVRQVDDCPAPPPEVQGRDVVGLPSEATDHAGKSALVGTVGPLGMPASGALPTGVAGVNKHHSDPGPLRFVGQFLSQVVESPGVQRGALRPPSPDPLADALQVLQGDRPIRALGLLHQVTGKAGMAYGHPLDALGEVWFTSWANRRSLPESFFRRRLAPFVPFFWSFRRSLDSTRSS